MVKVVIDTNVLVSAVLSPAGAPAKVVDMVGDGSLQLIVSPAIMAEYEEVLARKKFGLSASTVEAIVQNLRRLAIEVVASERLRACGDPADDKFLECAVAAGAAYVVTGNSRHFPKLFAGVRPLPPATFLREPGIP